MFLVVMCVRMDAQQRDYVVLPDLTVCNYSRLAADNGLSSNVVNVIFRDSGGLMWFGTEDGLNSYDGYSVKSYLPKSDDTSSICGKQIFGLSEMVPNVITVAVGDGGISLYNKRTHTFSTPPLTSRLNPFDRGSAYACYKSQNSLVIVHPESIVLHDTGTNDVIWVQRPTKFRRDGVKYGKVRVKTMPGDRGEMVMLTGSRSLSVFNVKNETVQECRFDNSFVIFDVCPQDADRVLLGTSSGLVMYNLRTGNIQNIDLLKNETVQVLTRNEEGDIWIAYGGNKLLKWMQSTNSICSIANGDAIFNQRTKVNEIFEDENDILWIATNNSGVLKLDVKPTKINHQVIDNSLPRDYVTTDISSFDVNHIWAACGINGFAHIDLQKGVAESIPCPHQNVTSVLARKDSTVILGSSRQLLCYEIATKRQWIIPFTDESRKNMNRFFVRHLSEDCLGNIWISCQYGVYRYNGVDFHRIFTDDGEDYVFNCTFEDSDGRIWGGSCSGAFVKDLNDTTFRHIGKRWLGCNDQGILCIAEFGQNILMGSSEGIMVFDKKTAEIVPTEYSSYFSSKTVYSIVCDRNGILWVNTSSGVGYIDAMYDNVYIFDRTDGLTLEGNECNKLSLVDDVIFFGQVACVNKIDTRDVAFNTRKPKAFISEVSYGGNGNAVAVNMINDSTYVQKFFLNSSMKLTLASTDFTNPKRNMFMYKLGNAGWIDLNTSNNVYLAGIMPGFYRIQLRSSNADKNWNTEPSTYYLKIESPLWLTRPALIFYAILVMCVIWLLLNMRFRSLNRRMRLAEAEAKSKSLVEDQRNRLAHVINEQNSSFNYAKRIQDALMPKVQSFQKYFAKLFVLYRPKEIVSGDFYTFYHRDGLTFVVASDCTGHGVPGAFISILGIDHLNYIIMQQKVNDAGEILTKLHDELHNAVKKISSEEINDGMDITICVIDHANRRINYAGAMNDLYLIRNNEVFEYRGSRMSVGTNISMDDSVDKPHIYTGTDIQCCGGDMMYLFSDGFIDQFGGPEQKKFKVRRFKNLLLNVHKLPSGDQKILLNQKFEEWRGALEQTDDVSVIGFQPWT